MLAAGSAQAGSPDAEIREIGRLEALYSQSFVTGDASVARRLLADSFIGYEPDAKASDKASILAEVQSDKRPSSLKITALTVRLHGDTAIALGTEEDTLPDSPEPAHRRWLDTWKKTSGGWRLVASAEIVPPP